MTSLTVDDGFVAILDAARANEPWAFERLFRWLGAPVAGYLRAQGAFDPDDLANEVFLQAFTHLDRFSGDETRFRTWVFAIAHHRLVDERRRAACRPRVRPGALDGFAAAPAGNVEDEVLESLGEQRVRELLGRLAPAQQSVLLLRILGDLTVAQTAEALGRSLGAVKALQRRGLACLRRELGAEAVPPGRPAA